MWNKHGADRATVEWLLGSKSIDEFAQQYYERAPLHVVRDRAGFYDRFFSLAELERVIFSTEIAKEGLFATKDGTPAREDSYVRKLDFSATGGAPKTIIDADRVGTLFAHGCSIVVDRIQVHSSGMASLCRALEAFFRARAAANVYLTPGGGSQGFSAHYDTHDAVIIQIEGTKQWRLYDWGTELALREQRHDAKKHPAGELKQELEMRPGDLLYIPRGIMHEARSSDALSLHVTIGLYPTLWIDVVTEALAAAREELVLRRSISVDAATNFGDPDVAAALARFVTPENLQAAAARLERKLATERRNELEGQLRQIALLRTLSERSSVSIRPHMLYELAEAEETTLSFSGKTIRLQRGAAEIVRALDGGEAVSVATLAAREPKALEIVRQLIADGFALQRELEPQERSRPSLRVVEDLAS